MADDRADWPETDGEAKKTSSEAGGALTKQSTESDLSKAGANSLLVDEDET